MVLNSITRITTAVSDLVFPPVCACCGQLSINRSDMICQECLSTRFEPDELTDGVILPESVAFRFSLWKFDKLGYLQDLLHKLKYDHLAGVGTSLGQELGKRLLESGLVENHIECKQKLILVPVPLYKKRHRKRGYNQSRVIAEGISDKSGIAVIREFSVLRNKNTATQTGLNSDERIKNLSNAFEVKNPELLEGRIPFVVDDVYTTGATTFELAESLYRVTGQKSAILTIAHS
ncbi:ComF family protein [soil metagenome]